MVEQLAWPRRQARSGSPSRELRLGEESGQGAGHHPAKCHHHVTTGSSSVHRKGNRWIGFVLDNPRRDGARTLTHLQLPLLLGSVPLLPSALSLRTSAPARALAPLGPGCYCSSVMLLRVSGMSAWEGCLEILSGLQASKPGMAS